MLPQFLIIGGAVTCDVTRGSAQEFRMVNYCVTFGCTSSSKDGIGVFRLPKDMKLRSKWIQQVKRTRANWSGPSYHSVLCSLQTVLDFFVLIEFVPVVGLLNIVGKASFFKTAFFFIP